MKKINILHIFAACVVLALSASCMSRGRVIPRAAMSEIYAEMFMADQWINSDYKLRRMADTTLIYGGIFEKYGYTVNDYRRSMEYYMDDPDRYARILKQTTLIIERRISDLKKEKERLQAIFDSKAATDAFVPERIFFLSGLANKDLLTVDSLSFYIDSTGGKFSFDVQKGYDTLFAGPQLVILNDTAKVCKPLASKDSLSEVPSLRTVTLGSRPELRFKEDIISGNQNENSIKKLKFDDFKK